ncbi:MAG: ribose-phosphate pyrophosphokinase [Ktedonobacteraceae bacterium]
MADKTALQQVIEKEGPPDLDIYCGSATPGLAREIAIRLGRPLGRRNLDQFPDGECHVQIQDSVRGRDIYIVQSTFTPVNERLMELLVMIDAFRRASASRITVIMPYYGYARQEKKSTGREPITAKLVANLLTTAGANRVVAIDLHSPAIQGFFDIEMIHLTTVPLLASYIRAAGNLRDAVLVTPDTGRVKVAEKYVNLLDLPLVVMHKQRSGERGEGVEISAIIGSVEGKRPIIIDDIIATGSTITTCARVLLAGGALPDMTVAAVHGVFSSPAEELLAMPEITRIIVTDTIPLQNKALAHKIAVISVADLLAETILRLHEGRSISALFSRWHDEFPV